MADRVGALVAARYPLEQADAPQAFARDDDAAGAAAPPRANAMWLGAERALEQIGVELGSEVTADALASALQGQHVASGGQVRVPGWKVVPDSGGRREAVVNSYDLTFSAPKSVSVVWSQADAKLRAGIERAMMVATNAALAHVTGTRPVVGGRETAAGFAASAALHVTARAAREDVVPAPQLHVHAHLVGVLDREGRLRTPNSAALYKHAAMREAGALARLVLARELEGLGFGIRACTGRGGRYFEIEGVPDGLCERLSGRTREVEAWISEQRARKGPGFSNRDAARGGMATRAAKVKVKARRAQEYWDQHAREFVFAIEGILGASAGERDPGVVWHEVRERLLERLWREGPTVSVGELRSMALELGTLGLSDEETLGLLVEMQRSGELIAVGDWRVTSRAIRGIEQYVLDVATRAAADRTGALSSEAVDAGIAVAEESLKGFSLDPEQVDAVGRLTAGARWGCLTGRAGTGKGPVLEAVAEAYRREGWTVIAGAVDGATTQRLGHQIKAGALTIEQILRRVEWGTLEVDERTVIVIEEASKVGLEHWRKLARLVEGGRARLIAVGDIGQIGAIECPGMLDVMLDRPGIPSARLETVRRHRDPTDRSKPHPWLDQYQAALYEGRSDEAIAILRRERAVEMHADRQAAMVGLVDRWERRRHEHDIAVEDAILIVHGSNDDVDRVNELAQQRRIRAGELTGAGVRAVDREYLIFERDVVMLREAAYQPTNGPRVENGTMGVVTRVDAGRERVWVAFAQPGGERREVVIDLGELRSRPRRPGEPVPALRLAYAGHPFPIQGATFRYVGSLWGHVSQGREETYSGDTRAVSWLDVHVDRESAGLDGSEDDRFARLARKLKHARHRVASITMRENPGIDLAWAQVDLGVTPEPPRQAVDGPALKALEAYRELLGPDRLAVIGRHAEAAIRELAGLGHAALRVVRDGGCWALEQLDKAAAFEARRLERDRNLLIEPSDHPRRNAHERRAAEHDQQRAARVRARETALHESGRHPDQWVRVHGRAFGRGIAAQHRLDVERSSSIHPETPARETGIGIGIGR